MCMLDAKHVYAVCMPKYQEVMKIKKAVCLTARLYVLVTKGTGETIKGVRCALGPRQRRALPNLPAVDAECRARRL